MLKKKVQKLTEILEIKSLVNCNVSSPLKEKLYELEKLLVLEIYDEYNQIFGAGKIAHILKGRGILGGYEFKKGVDNYIDWTKKFRSDGV